MNVWAWVEQAYEELRSQGQERLAYLLYRLPEAVCADEHAQVEALVPEALGLARATRNPWLEIFVRHWHLQSRVLKRMEGAALAEAVSLVEFSHRPENRDCPQSVCTTQDLASCYSCADGPGYAPERLALAGETLQRLNPSWNCFICVSGEYAEALVDSGRYQEALDFLATQERQVGLNKDTAKERQRLFRWRFWSLFHLGRYNEALNCAEKALEILDEIHLVNHARILKALALSALNRPDEATDCLPSLAEVGSTVSFYGPMASTLERLVPLGRVSNDLALDRVLRRFQRDLQGNRVVRVAFEMALRRARLALARERKGTARQCLEEAEAMLAELRTPLQAPLQIAELRSQLGDCAVVLSESPDLLVVDPDPELALEILAAAWERWPGHPKLRDLLIRALWQTEQSDRLLRVLQEWFQKEPDNPQAVGRLGEFLLAENRLAELLELCAGGLTGKAQTELTTDYLWLRARGLRRLRRLQEARADLEAIIELDPGVVNTRLLLAEVCLKLNDPAAGLKSLFEVVRLQGDEVGPWDWDIMTHATILDDWATLRRHAARLEIELQGSEGPVDERWEFLRLRIREEDGSERDWFGQRTGPVSAIVLQFPDIGSPKGHLNDRVVFDAEPLTPGGDDDLKTFQVLSIKERGQARTFVMEGVHPGEPFIQELRAALSPEMRIRDASSEEYRIELSDGTTVPGLYAQLAVFPSLELAQAHSRLLEATTGWPQPAFWPGLAREAGLLQAAADQEARAEELGISLDES